MIWSRRSATREVPEGAVGVGPAAAPLVAEGPLIALRNLERFYEAGGTRHVRPSKHYADIALGDFVSIMGPSGAGKSTLLNVLGMLDSGWSGEYTLAGQAVHRLQHKARIGLGRRYVGFVFQQYHLLDELTVAENLEVPLSYRDVPKAERQAWWPTRSTDSASSARRTSILASSPAANSSSSAFARAVIARPAVILADEPTGNLHSSQGREIMAMFRELNNKGTTIIQVTHSEENAAVGKRIVQLRDGWMT